MTADGDALGDRLDLFRSYLMLLAETRLQPRLRARLDPADLVQQTLLRAFERRDQFVGTADAQRAAWLRTLLAHTMIDAARHLGRGEGKAWERSLESALEQSSARLETFLADDQTSPSLRAERQEAILRLADALNRLPDDQRRAVELKHLQGLSLVEVANRLNKTVSAVAGLLQRGLRDLRKQLGDAWTSGRDSWKPRPPS